MENLSEIQKYLLSKDAAQEKEKAIENILGYLNSKYNGRIQYIDDQFVIYGADTDLIYAEVQEIINYTIKK